MIRLVDINGNIAANYRYDPYGKAIAAFGSHATINPLRYRGYVFDHETGLYYLQSRYYDPETVRFLNADALVSTGQGLIGNNMFAYCGNNPVCRYDNGGTDWKECVYIALHVFNIIGMLHGIDTARFGAAVLWMHKDGSGVYHANYICPQILFGYNELYDFAFDVGTSMVAAPFPFTYGGQGYTIWAWKGDYINLGAGAEMGIYHGTSGHRVADPTLALEMCITLWYQNKCIAHYYPSQKQWWITAFNPDYLMVDANDLTAYLGVRFSNRDMYYAFKSAVYDDGRWSFNDARQVAVLTL